MYHLFKFYTGHFPLFVIRERVKDIIEELIACTDISASTLKWAESRKEALHSLIMICQTLGIDEAGKFHFNFPAYIAADDITYWIERKRRNVHLQTNGNHLCLTYTIVIYWLLRNIL